MIPRQRKSSIRKFNYPPYCDGRAVEERRVAHHYGTRSTATGTAGRKPRSVTGRYRPLAANERLGRQARGRRGRRPHGDKFRETTRLHRSLVRRMDVAMRSELSIMEL